MSGPASKRYHNRVARKYDAIYDDDFWRFHDAVTWELIKPHLPRDASARCLDVGCGTGKWGLKLMKSGFATTFVDHAPAMVGEVRGKLDALGTKADGCRAEEADIVDLAGIEDATYALTVAMGDPLSICRDPQRAANAMFRCSTPGGVVIATADNRLAAADAYLDRGNVDAAIDVLKTGRTQWVTGDKAEQFALHTFTPDGLRRLFARSGFEVLGIYGKTVLPIRRHRDRLADRDVYRKLLKAELDLCRDPLHAARAGHLQIHARRPG
jgi:ubiquinone/menaquinone biosynthesis C-methylase UbiE